MTKNIFTSTNFQDFSKVLRAEFINLKHKPIIMCIGSNKVLSDMVGPLVGTILRKHNIKAYVYGNLNNPITAINLKNFYAYINETHKDAKILVVDSSLGVFEQTGTIILKRGGIIPAALNGNKIKVGDLSFLAVTLDNGLRNKLLLRGAKIELITKMAQIIARSIADSFNHSFG